MPNRPAADAQLGASRTGNATGPTASPPAIARDQSAASRQACGVDARPGGPLTLVMKQLIGGDRFGTVIDHQDMKAAAKHEKAEWLRSKSGSWDFYGAKWRIWAGSMADYPVAAPRFNLCMPDWLLTA